MQAARTTWETIAGELKVWATMAGLALPAMGALTDNESRAAQPAENNITMLEPRVRTEVVRFGNIREVLTKWSPQHRLFVKGDVGLDDVKLAQLAEFLAQRPNWTVILLQHSKGDIFVESSTGRQYEGADAWHQFVQKGLPQKPDFSQHKSSNGGLPDNAIFCLGISDALLLYTPGQHQDAFGAQHTKFLGETGLSREAKKAMRNRGNPDRVLEAAENTIKLIDLTVTQEIARQRQEAERNARQKVEDARQALGSAQDVLGRVEKGASQFREKYPSATGDLAHPPVDRLRSRLDTASKEFVAESYALVRSESQAISSAAEQLLRLQTQYPIDGKTLDGYQKRLEALKKDPLYDAFKKACDEAEALYGATRAKWERGDSAYSEGLALAGAKLEAAERAIAGRKFTDKAKGATLYTVGGLALLGALATGVFLNLSRKRSKREAEEQIRFWKDALDKKKARLLDLAGEPTDASPYQGATKKVAEQVLDDTDRLFSMLNWANEVLNQATALVRPACRAKRAANLFFKGSYRAALARLSHERLPIKPEDEIAAIFAPEKRQADALSAEIGHFKEVTVSFEQFMDTFNQIADRAQLGLEQIRNGSKDAAAKSQAAKAQTETLGSTAGAFLDRSRESKWVVPETEVARLLERLKAENQTAEANIANDPVASHSASTAVLATAETAIAFLNEADQLRAKAYEEIKSKTANLAADGLSTSWVGVEFAGLSEYSAAYLRGLTDELGKKHACRLGGMTDELLQRVTTACSLVEASHAADREIKEIEVSIAEARAAVGKALGHEPKDMLTEQKNNPSDLLAEARRSFEQTRDLLGRGKLEDAQEALHQLKASAGRAREIAKASLEALSTFESNADAVKLETDRRAEAAGASAGALEQLVSRYHPDALRIGPSGEVDSNAKETISDNIAEIKRALEDGVRLEASSRELFAEGRLLEATAELEAIRQRHVFVDGRFNEITQRKALLEKLDAQNAAALSQNQQFLGHLRPSIDSGISRTTTVEAAGAAERLLRQTQMMTTSEKIDPFSVQEALGEVQRQLAAVESSFRKDKQLRDEAARSIQAASEQMGSLDKALNEARRDSVIDSAVIEEVRRASARYQRQVLELGKRAAQPHQDWALLDREADSLFETLQQATSTVSGEMELGRKALKEGENARSSIENAKDWAGGHLVKTAAALELLRQAEEALGRGESGRSVELFKQAKTQINAAVEKAEKEWEAQRKREREESRGAAAATPRAQYPTAARETFDDGPTAARETW